MPYEPPIGDGPDPDRLRDEAWDRERIGSWTIFVCEVCGTEAELRDLTAGCPKCGETMVPA